MVLGKVFKIIFFFILFLIISYPNLYSQIESIDIVTADIDSLLTRYHLEGVKIFVKKLGVISIRDKTVSLERSEMDNRLLIVLQKSLSLNESGFGAKFDYIIHDNWVLRGESYQRSWGQQSGVNIIYRLDF